MANEVPSVTDAEAQRKEEERKLAEAKEIVAEYERASKGAVNGVVFYSNALIDKEAYLAELNTKVKEIEDQAQKEGRELTERQAETEAKLVMLGKTLTLEDFQTKYKGAYETAKQYIETHKQPENQQGNGGKPQAEPVVGEQGNKAEEKEKIDIADKDVDFALRMVPTYVQDFMKVNGMLPEEHKRMNTRELKAYLTSAEFSKEQKELLTGYLKDREQRKAEFEAYIKDPTKQSMKEDYVKAAQVKAEREQSLKEAQEQLKAITTKALEEEAKKVIPTQAAVTKALNVKVEPINVNTPVVKVGKTEVTKNNGKKKEKDAIIVIEGDRTYTLTKEMVKEVRKKEGKDAFPSFKKMMKAAENGTLPSTVVKSCFVKAYQLETGLNLDAMDGNKLKDDIKKPVQISLPFKKGREM